MHPNYSLPRNSTPLSATGSNQAPSSQAQSSWTNGLMNDLALLAGRTVQSSWMNDWTNGASRGTQSGPRAPLKTSGTFGTRKSLGSRLASLAGRTPIRPSGANGGLRFRPTTISGAAKNKRHLRLRYARSSRSLCELASSNYVGTLSGGEDMAIQTKYEEQFIRVRC